MNINNLGSVDIKYQLKEKTITNKNVEISMTKEKLKVKEKNAQGISNAAVYQHTSEEENEQPAVNQYKPDMEKIMAMKEESDKRLVDLLRATIKDGSLKQLGGVRGLLEKLNGGEIKLKDLLDKDYSAEDIDKAKKDTAEDGYWGAEQTSQRFLDFAKALSGGDPAKADMLLDAVKEGYKAAEEIWGEELPQLSKDTLALTIKKFEAWRDGTEEAVSSEV